MKDGYPFSETSARQQISRHHARAAAPHLPRVAPRHRLASRLRRVADRLDD